MLNLKWWVKTIGTIFKEVQWISDSDLVKPHTVSSILKNELGMAYWRAKWINWDGDWPDVVENRAIFKWFFTSLVGCKCRFIWIDESSFNPWAFKFYSWVKKHEYDPLYEFPYGHTTTAICALTDEGVNFCQMWHGTNTVWEWLMFLIDLE